MSDSPALTVLQRVASVLDRAGIPYALIGATALAVHGISRSTLDQDLLTIDAATLTPALWHQLPPAVSVDIRPGDADDPLAGVVRFRAEGERDVDLVVGHGGWQRDILARATRVQTPDAELPVVQAADLILLKLYAGGSQDKWDIEQLLASDAADVLRKTVESRVSSLPLRCRELWAESFRP